MSRRQPALPAGGVQLPDGLAEWATQHPAIVAALPWLAEIIAHFAELAHRRQLEWQASTRLVSRWCPQPVFRLVESRELTVEEKEQLDELLHLEAEMIQTQVVHHEYRVPRASPLYQRLRETGKGWQSALRSIQLGIAALDTRVVVAQRCLDPKSNFSRQCLPGITCCRNLQPTPPTSAALPFEVHALWSIPDWSKREEMRLMRLAEYHYLRAIEARRRSE